MENMQDSVQAAQKDGLMINALGDEVVVYDPDGRRASCLNSFAAEVLALCDGQRSASDITRELPFEDVDERLVWLALADLQKAELLQDRVSVPPNAYARTNRRELLRRIGMGAAVAVPVVAGVALPPNSAQASHGACAHLGEICNDGDSISINCCEGSCSGAASGNSSSCCFPAQGFPCA